MSGSADDFIFDLGTSDSWLAEGTNSREEESSSRLSPISSTDGTHGSSNAPSLAASNEAYMPYADFTSDIPTTMPSSARNHPSASTLLSDDFDQLLSRNPAPSSSNNMASTSSNSTAEPRSSTFVSPNPLRYDPYGFPIFGTEDMYQPSFLPVHGPLINPNNDLFVSNRAEDLRMPRRTPWYPRGTRPEDLRQRENFGYMPGGRSRSSNTSQRATTYDTPPTPTQIMANRIRLRGVPPPNISISRDDTLRPLGVSLRETRRMFMGLHDNDTPTVVNLNSAGAASNNNATASNSTESEVIEFPPKAWGETGLKLLVNPTSSSKCSICLADELEDPSAINSCKHVYCYECLKKWSTQKPLCPLCKRTFKKIYHKVEADDKYEVYDVPAPPSTSFADRLFTADNAAPRSFIYPLLYRRYMYFVSRYDRLQSEGRHMRATLPNYSGDENRSAACIASVSVDHLRMRRIFYERNVLTTRSSRTPSRSRVGGDYFGGRSYEAHRIFPFVRREIIFLFGFDNQDIVAPLSQAIIPLLVRPGLQTREIHDRLQPLLGTYTERFLHEIVQFARTDCVLETYDREYIHPVVDNRNWDHRITTEDSPFSRSALGNRIIRSALGKPKYKVNTPVPPPLQDRASQVMDSQLVRTNTREMSLEPYASRPRFNRDHRMRYLAGTSSMFHHDPVIGPSRRVGGRRTRPIDDITAINMSQHSGFYNANSMARSSLFDDASDTSSSANTSSSLLRHRRRHPAVPSLFDAAASSSSSTFDDCLIIDEGRRPTLRSIIDNDMDDPPIPFGPAIASRSDPPRHLYDSASSRRLQDHHYFYRRAREYRRGEAEPSSSSTATSSFAETSTPFNRDSSSTQSRRHNNTATDNITINDDDEPIDLTSSSSMKPSTSSNQQPAAAASGDSQRRKRKKILHPSSTFQRYKKIRPSHGNNDDSDVVIDLTQSNDEVINISTDDELD